MCAKPISKQLKREAVQILLNNPIYVAADLRQRLAAAKHLARTIRQVKEEMK
jgi:hypothetical protein